MGYENIYPVKMFFPGSEFVTGTVVSAMKAGQEIYSL